MRTRSSHLELIAILLLIVGLTVVVVLSLQGGRYLLALLVVVLLALCIYRLIRSVDRNNRRLSYLFRAMENEDFSTRFNEDVPVASEKELYQQLNRVNEVVKEATTNSRIQERYYEEILTQANIGLLTINDRGHVLFSNPTALRLFDRPLLNHIKQLEQVDSELYILLKDLHPFERRLFKFHNERDSIQLAIKSSRIKVKKEELMLLVIQDIRTELDRQETDSWNRLIRVLTHEIMNSIAPITSVSESLAAYFKDGGGVRGIGELQQEDIDNTVKGLGVIEEQGKNLMNFVQAYRSYLNVPVPDRRPLPVRTLLERVKLLMEPQVGEADLEIRLHPEVEDLEVFADEKLISLVLINLMKNAIEAMKGQEGGLIELQSSTGADGRRSISIRDNGPGIPEEVMDQIFIPFFSTKEQGTGIGLSLSKQIMQVHDGHLAVRSEVGVGTEFVMWF